MVNKAVSGEEFIAKMKKSYPGIDGKIMQTRIPGVLRYPFDSVEYL